MRVAGPADEMLPAVGRWLLAAAMIGSALALGGVHTAVLAVVAIGAAIAMALVWWRAPPVVLRTDARILIIVAVVLIGWTMFQLIPLPRGLLAAIAPANADVWDRALTPLHEPGPAFAPISLDPSATRVEVLKGLTYLVFYLAALRVAQRQPGTIFLKRVIIATAVVAAGASLAHPAIGAEQVFGLYQPHETYAYLPHHLGPLLNTNHLAAYCNIGLLLALACAIEERDVLPRLPAAAIVLLLAATTIWTGSRGGAATMFVGVLVVGAFVLVRRRHRGSRAMRRTLRAVASVAAVLVVGLGLLVVFDTTRDKLFRNDLSKLDVFKNAMELVRSHGIFGVGRGAFESVFPSVRTSGENLVFTHPENVIAQWATEWGLPLTILGFLAIARALRPQAALARSRPPSGAYAALVAVALQNLVDFSSELPAVMIALTACAAVVTGGTGGVRKSDAEEPVRSRQVVLAAAPAVAAILAAFVALLFDDHELYYEKRAFRDLGVDRTITAVAFHDEVRAAMLRHPAEPYFPFVGAVRASVARDESVLPWAARALERSPKYGRVHLLLARSLFQRSPAQARLEYRLGCEEDASTCLALTEAVPLVHDATTALELVPAGARGVGALTTLASYVERRLPATVVVLDREIMAREPSAVAPVARVAAGAIKDVRGNEPWCAESERSGCLEHGFEAANRLRAAAPRRCDGHFLRAELMVAEGNTDAAFAELDHAVDLVEDRADCARRYVRLAEQQHDQGRVTAALERLAKLGCDTTSECVDNLVFAAHVEADRGSGRRSLSLLQRASERAPEREDLLVLVAQQAEAERVYGEALTAYSKLAELQPDEPRWRAGVARTRNAVGRGLLEQRTK